MTAVFLSPLYLLLNVYLLWRIFGWLHTLSPRFDNRVFRIVFSVIYAVAALSPLAAAFGMGSLQTFGRLVNNHWLAALLYLIGLTLFCEVVRLIVCLVRRRSPKTPINERAYRICGSVIAVTVLATQVFGTMHAYQIKTTPYDVTVEKEAPLEHLKIALVSDLHLGMNVGVTHVRKMQAIIEEMQPDLIVYAGDIFDNDFDAISNPDEICEIFRSLESTYGSYACWGNHDIKEKILAGFTFSDGDATIASDPRMDAFLEDAGIKLLKDESVLIDDLFYISGRQDASCKSKSGIIRMTADELLADLDHSKPLIVMDHQPSELNELAAAGADLVLSGHTHDGQIFPGNLTTRMMWQNSCGMIKIDQMTNVVTSGLGIWGPALRLGTDGEVAALDVTFKA